MRRYLDECVDCHNGHVGLTLGIVHEVEVDKFLQLQILSLHTVDHVREQGAETNIQHLVTQVHFVKFQ